MPVELYNFECMVEFARSAGGRGSGRRARSGSRGARRGPGGREGPGGS